MLALTAILEALVLFYKPLPMSLGDSLRPIALTVIPVFGAGMITMLFDPLAWRVIRVLRRRESHLKN